MLKYAKIRLTMLCLSGFELYSRWVPLILNFIINLILHVLVRSPIAICWEPRGYFLDLSL